MLDSRRDPGKLTLREPIRSILVSMVNPLLMISKLPSLEDISIWSKDSFTRLPWATMMFNLRKMQIFMDPDTVTKKAAFIKRNKTRSCLRTR
jgi:hypothetical protein